MSEVEDINKDYYNDLYKKRNLSKDIIYPLISFDQQSKSKRNYSLLKPLLKTLNDRNSKFLDYGFGHGSMLLKIPKKFDLYGCDISIEAVKNFPRVAKFYGKKVTTFLPDQFDEITADFKFDVISSSHVLEHVPDDEGTLNRLTSKLKKGGFLLINLPINEVWEDPKHLRKYKRERVIELIQERGFKIIKIEEVARINGFLIRNEQVLKRNLLIRVGLKFLRGFLAVAPVCFMSLCDKILSENHPNTHIIVLAQKI